MIFNVSGGTSVQRGYFSEAVALIKKRFPLDEFSDVVAVTFPADPEPTMQGELAYTTVFPGTPPTATLKIKSNLGLVPPPFGGVRTWFIECVAHEIGHIVALKWTDAQKTAFCAIVGASFPGDWDTGALSQTDWPRSAAEAAAEAFKDMYIDPANRATDNRTIYSVPASKTDEADDLFRAAVPRPPTTPPSLTNDGGLLIRSFSTPVEHVYYWARAYQIRTAAPYNVWGPYWNVTDPPGNISGQPLFPDNPPSELPESAIRVTATNISPTARISLSYDLTSIWDDIVAGWRWEIYWWADNDVDGKGDLNQFDNYYIGPYPIVPGPTGEGEFTNTDVDWNDILNIRYANSLSLQAVRTVLDCPIQGSIQLVPPSWATAVQLRGRGVKPYFSGGDS